MRPLVSVPLADPRDRSLEVLQLEGGKWRELDTFEEQGLVRAPPFDAIELDLGALFRW